MQLCVRRVDSLDRAQEISAFSWSAVGRLLARALQGTLLVPVSAVSGRTELTFDAAGRCTRHVERLDQVADADGRRLRNRRVTQDAAVFMDVCRRPHGAVEPEEWAAAVSARVLSGVPGAGVLDVDPNADDATPAAFLAVAFVSVALASAGIASFLGFG